MLKNSEEELQTIIADYFKDIFTSCNLVDFIKATDGLNMMVNEEMNQDLNVLPTSAEIHSALNQMDPNKTPGIDGISLFF